MDGSPTHFLEDSATLVFSLSTLTSATVSWSPQSITDNENGPDPNYSTASTDLLLFSPPNSPQALPDVLPAAIDLSDRCSDHSDDLFLDSSDTILFSPSAVNLPSSPDIGSDILISPLSLPGNSTASSPLSTSLPRHCGTYPNTRRHSPR